MFGSVALEVLIGLAMVYTLLSLLSSTVLEGVAAVWGWRGECLRSAIARLLGETYDEKGKGQEGALHARVFRHPLIASLRKGDRNPSYIPKEVFADVLVDLVAAEKRDDRFPQTPESNALALLRAIEERSTGGEEPDWRRSLRLLLQQARLRAGDGCENAAQLVEALKVEIGRWFDHTMSRASGWYRRKTQWSQTIIALCIVVPLNADTLSIVDELATNPGKREAAATMAEGLSRAGFVDRAAPDRDASATAEGATAISPQEALKRAKARLADLEATGLTLGWSSMADLTDSPIRKILGLLMTVLAVALGAPFWFQVLERLVRLRGSGKQLATDETKPAGTSAARPTDGGTTDGAARDASAAEADESPAHEAPPPLSDVEWDAFSAYWNDIGGALPQGSTTADGDRLAVVSSYMSALAYKDDFVVEGRLAAMLGAKPEFEFFDVNGTQAFAVRLGDDVLVAYRGTEPTEIQDIMADATFALAPDGTRGFEVHRGFARALDLVQTAIDEWIAKHLPDDGRLHLTGHSLGAALATLHCARLSGTYPAERLRLVTFGSPRVGDAAFQAHFDGFLGGPDARKTVVRRYVNDRDLVTRVAPRRLRFQHVGDECFIDAEGWIHEGRDGRDKWLGFTLFLVDAAASFQNAAKETVSDHSMDGYARRVTAWVRGLA